MLDFKLYAIGNLTLVRDLTLFVSEAARGGLRAFQLREKDLSGRSLFDLTKNIRNAAPHCKLFINDRADIAMSSGADGVHLPETSWPTNRIRQSFPQLQCGVSVHSLDGAKLAEENEADFIVFGPVFDTPSKQSIGMEAQGLAALSEIAHNINIPAFAIGGITPERARQCIQHGAWGVATMSDLLTAPNISERLGEYKEALGSL
jgi:thiamine-phosphate pyrophosphorylase